MGEAAGKGDAGRASSGVIQALGGRCISEGFCIHSVLFFWSLVLVFFYTGKDRCEIH